MTDCNPSPTPVCTTSTLEWDTKAGEVPLYRQLVGVLLYIAKSSRPDIGFAVQHLSQFVSKSTKAHLIAAKRVLRYLKGTMHYRLTYSWGSP